MPDVIRELSPQLTGTLRWSVYLKSHDEGFYGLYTESYKTSRKVHTALNAAEKKRVMSQKQTWLLSERSHLTYPGVQPKELQSTI